MDLILLCLLVFVVGCWIGWAAHEYWLQYKRWEEEQRAISERPE